MKDTKQNASSYCNSATTSTVSVCGPGAVCETSQVGMLDRAEKINSLIKISDLDFI